MLSASQIPKDGVGREKTLYGRGIRLKAKDLAKTTSTTLKITGMTSGAVWYVDLVVMGSGQGEPVRFNPPSVTPPGRPPTGGYQPERQEQRQDEGRDGGLPPKGRGGREEERGGRDEGRQGREEEKRGDERETERR